jgi:hypothetical protein
MGAFSRIMKPRFHRPITVRVSWRRHDPHPSTQAAIALLTELYRRS